MNWNQSKQDSLVKDRKGDRSDQGKTEPGQAASLELGDSHAGNTRRWFLFASRGLAKKSLSPLALTLLHLKRPRKCLIARNLRALLQFIANSPMEPN